MRSILTGLLILLSINGHSQNLTREIDEQVWKPFIDAFTKFDSEGFMSVHSKELIRSPRDAREVLSWDQYYHRQQASDRKQKENGSARVIELRFTERLSNSTQAIDVGIYKTTVTSKDGKNASFYGRFHVILRKEGGRWKILVDTDSTENNTINEDDFLAAVPIERP